MDEIYYETAFVVRKVIDKEDSLRNQVFSNSTRKKKQLLRLCCDILKYRKVLTRMITEIPELAADPAFDKDEIYTMVMLYEFLWGKQGLKSDKRTRSALEKRRAQILGVKRTLIEEGVLSSDGESLAEKTTTSTESSKASWSQLPIPRYARINTLLTDMGSVVKKLLREGWEMIPVENLTRKKYRKLISTLKPHQFCVDRSCFGVLVFPRGTDMHSTPWVEQRELILQDKASCLPVICLNPEPGSTVVDTCAAPGIKTSHIAALMQNEGKVLAYDKDASRFATMRQLLYDSGVTCSEIEKADFLKVNVYSEQLQDVKYVLVDPPCSGSGIVSRMDFLTDTEERTEETANERRLNSLGNIQAMLLKHALRIPSVQRLVYSTCSIHERENEMVIAEILGTEEFSEQFEVVHAMPLWKHRGKKGYPFGHSCLRSSPDKDLTNGFFVAVFQRLNKHSEDE